jgi:predicted XRE-type DNA-binding protein
MRRVADPVPALKRQLADRVLELLEGWSNTWAAWDARLSRSRISEMRNGNLDNLSLDRLVRCLDELGHTVEITVTRKPRRRTH